jgi:hypothetical protein
MYTLYARVAAGLFYLVKTVQKVLALTVGILIFFKIVASATLAQSDSLAESKRRLTEIEIESLSRLWQTDPRLLTPILEQSFEVNLRGYGNIYFLSFMEDNSSEMPQFLSHWIVDKEGVHKELPTPKTMRGKNGSFISLDAVVFGELDFDGFTDIYTIASYAILSSETQADSSEVATFPVVTLYVQNPEDQSFQILEDESIALTERGVSTVGEVEEILRGEMLFLP